AQLGDPVVRDVVRLAGVGRLSNRVDGVRRRCEAGVARLEAVDALTQGLGSEQSLTDLDDLAEGKLVQRVMRSVEERWGEINRRGGGRATTCGSLRHGEASGPGRQSVAGILLEMQEVARKVCKL